MKATTRRADGTIELDDRVHELGLADNLVDYLLLRTSVNDVAQFAVHHLIDRLRVWHLAILRCTPEGHLTKLGSFGHSDSADAPSLAGHNFMTDPNFRRTLAKGLPHSSFPLPGWTSLDFHEMERWQHARGPELLWPLQIPARTVGVLQFNFLSVPDASEVIEDVSAISPVFSLLALHASPPDRDSASTFGSPVDSGIDTLTHSLSDRQLDILKWMSMGMTNDQIAHQIKFSASTVRQETMVIYRFLHVGGRSEAAAEGKRLGLI